MTDVPLKTGEHVLPFNATIRWAAYSHYCEFRVREIAGEEGDGVPLYVHFDEAGAFDPTIDFEKGDRVVDGSIKWDGCSHLYFGDSKNDGYLHLCGGYSFAALTVVLRTMFEIAAREIPAFDRECAKVEALLK
jgi:hypothetical protein